MAKTCLKNTLFFGCLLKKFKKKKEKIVTSQARNNCRPNFIMVSDKSFNKSKKKKK